MVSPRQLRSSTASSSPQLSTDGAVSVVVREAVINLLALCLDLRWRNLLETETAALDPPGRANFDVCGIRTADGSFNELAKPWMGWRMHVSAKSARLVRSPARRNTAPCRPA
jgi:hypothetical protein